MPQRTKYLLITAALLLVFLPIWMFAISPRLFPKIACVIQQPNGAVVKGWGEAACVNNGMPTIVLRADDLKAN